ncbi:hypothetical protein [Sphingobium yanoikuyae]|uniref:hypothetical protein n=1 Tax=Sphingobium yanoikuyae TaxID=13690 RepID=UPI0028A9A944|nr:hypothetical protein [Sphingobium yanoikuyae]
MRDLRRRLTILELSRPHRSKGSHCLQWWPGMSWADVLERHGDIESIRRGDRVTLLRFAAYGQADPIMQHEMPLAESWLAERGVAHV